MANLTYAGRVYQNPMNPQEIWANIGWNTHGKQLFPPWEPALGADVSEGDYNKIMDALQSEFANSPTPNFALAHCAMMLCILTGGILSCPLCYLKMKINEFNAKLKELPGRGSMDLCLGGHLWATTSFLPCLQVCHGRPMARQDNT
ncbi:unnamed protein product [Prorocentrum cordatum]|uniref:Uncharacterized protein n=1 Tax=Prorocentrum cordatum TaxID=2364126 RepID=A0ABN9PZ08_9DINO|nr:unnamed protein product [Polarella glacialis]